MIDSLKGKIISVQGQTPGPASGITYTIAYEEGESVLEISGQAPVMRQWPDEYDTDGQAQVGKRVPGLRDQDGLILWFFAERPVITQCNPPPQTATLIDPVTGQVVTRLPPPSGGATTPSGQFPAEGGTA